MAWRKLSRLKGLTCISPNLTRVGVSLQQRAELGCLYHAICLLTIRIWSIGHVLHTAAASIRELPDEALLSNGVRAKTLPIVVGNPMNLLDNAKKYSEALHALSHTLG